jgi:hypothetical protein
MLRPKARASSLIWTSSLDKLGRSPSSIHCDVFIASRTSGACETIAHQLASWMTNRLSGSQHQGSGKQQEFDRGSQTNLACKQAIYHDVFKTWLQNMKAILWSQVSTVVLKPLGRPAPVKPASRNQNLTFIGAHVFQVCFQVACKVEPSQVQLIFPHCLVPSVFLLFSFLLSSHHGKFPDWPVWSFSGSAVNWSTTAAQRPWCEPLKHKHWDLGATWGDVTWVCICLHHDW